MGLQTPEDVRLIPSGQNLYLLDFSDQLMFKITQDNFSAFAGDILVVEEGLGT